MVNGDVVELTQQALWLVMLLSAPSIAVATIVGLVVAFLQAATQIQEQTLQYAVKFFAIVLTIFVTASLLGGTLYQFAARVFAGFAGMVVMR